MLRISNIKIDIDDDISLVRKKLCKRLKINDKDIIEYSIYKESIDARKKDSITLVYTVDIVLKNESKFKKISQKDITYISTNKYIDVKMGNEVLEERPVIIGAGPAGLFAALILSQRGYKPILFERGVDVDKRTMDIEEFWNNGKLDPNSNVQFGEGGAGTFSDGKLTTRLKDIRSERVLREFVRFGAPEEIIYSHKPHIGTDILKNVIKNLRKEIIACGGEVLFSSCLTGMSINNGEISEVEINSDKKIKCKHVILAIGHSARDTYRKLYENGVFMEPKPFAIGARIEHPQELINKSQYGIFADHHKLGAADYKLTAHTQNGRSVYTFCMCPGGSVIASASSEGMLVTNGMSEHARNKENANSGLLVNIDISDFESKHPLAGVDFQEKYERLAFKLGGSNYFAPCQLVGDFINGKKSDSINSVKPSYKPGVKLTDLSHCLPNFVVEAMREAIQLLDKKLVGFGMHDAVLTGVETRSSAPIRIKRNLENLQSVNVAGLYPCGEGAGYAGGIVTAAVDGIRCAEKIIEKYSNEGL